MTDPDLATTAQGQIDAVNRTVTVTDNGSAVRTVASLQQDYPTSIDELWAACTEPERLVRWFAPVKGDLRLGGTYQIEGNAGGTIKSCEAPRGFTVSWEFGGEVTELTVRLESDGAARSTTRPRAHRRRRTAAVAGVRPRRRRHRVGPGPARPGSPSRQQRRSAGPGHRLGTDRAGPDLHVRQQPALGRCLGCGGNAGGTRPRRRDAYHRLLSRHRNARGLAQRRNDLPLESSRPDVS